MFGKDVKRASRQKVITLKLTTNSYCSSVFSLYLLIFKDSFGWSLRIKIILWILFELFWFRLVHLRTIIAYTPLSLLKYQGSPISIRVSIYWFVRPLVCPSIWLLHSSVTKNIMVAAVISVVDNVIGRVFIKHCFWAEKPQSIMIQWIIDSQYWA